MLFAFDLVLALYLAVSLTLGALLFVWINPPHILCYRKVGGISFLRIARYQFSFCRCRQPLSA
jgi:hypothetical protein